MYIQTHYLRGNSKEEGETHDQVYSSPVTQSNVSLSGMTLSRQFSCFVLLSVLSRVKGQDGKIRITKLTKVIVTVRSTRKTKETEIPKDKTIESKLFGGYDKEKEIRQCKRAPKASNADGNKENAP